ncbi:MAG TPA: hypothetical protein VH834_18230 [Solirubrobacteraceae bacterium]|jgi:hypothetical protein
MEREAKLLALVALELEAPALGEVNRQIVALGGDPIPPREPWLTQATAEVSRRRKQKEDE